MIVTPMTIFLLMLLFFGCSGSDTEVSNEANDQPVSESFTLARITSEQELEDILKTGISNRTGYSYYPETPGMDDIPVMMEGSSASLSSSSSTNLQVNGVDEADLVKNHGSYLYHAVPAGYSLDSSPPGSGNRLRILRMLSGPERTEKVAAEIVIGSAGSPAVDGLYLVTERPGEAPDLLIALAGRSFNWQGMWFDPWYWNSGRTILSIHNVDNPELPASVADLELDGALISSRRVGETLYLVTRYQPGLPEYQPAPLDDGQALENRQILDAATLPDLLPAFSVDNGAAQPLVRATDCYAIPTFIDNPRYGDIITVTAVDLANPGQPESQCLVGATETIFVSTGAMYLASSRYRYENGGGGSPGNAAPAALLYPETIHTDIHKFGLEGAAVTYRGSGSVAGHLGWEQDKKSFRFGEVGNALGVVTSLGDTWDGTATTRLTLLGSSSGNGTGPLSVIGELPNEQRPEKIGKQGEKLYAARFLGNRLYLVTFRVTDPLYAIDLSDPGDPAIIGELSIPGYSDYLHPIGDDLLLGIGKDAVADSDGGDGRGAWYQGVKLSLFDISKPDQPSELQSVVIGKRGSDSTVLHDHHGFSFLSPDPSSPVVRFALPVSRHDGQAQYGDPAAPWTSYNWTDTGLHLFELDTTPGSASVTSLGSIVAESFGGNTSYPLAPVWHDRSVITATGVHYLHGGKVWSADW
jgi:uncharacterized secreted protein with C-terminal beta-propeller domain